MKALLALGVLVAAIAAVSGGPFASAQVPASRAIDRTVSCATGLQGGLRSVTIQASSKAANPGYAWAVTNVQPTGRIASLGQTGLELSPFCRVVRTSVPLTPRGLDGSVASPFDDQWGCSVPPRVVLRVRAVFGERAPALRRGDPWGFPILFAHRPVREGSLVLRTPSGKAVALVRLLSSGKVQVLTSGSCFPD